MRKHLEAQRVHSRQRLEPDRYLIATSVHLTRRRKAEIQNGFAPWMLSPDDVFAPYSNRFLDHPEVEARQDTDARF
jgi:hypothetical protein